MSELLAIGRVVKTKGVRGQVKVITFSGHGESLQAANSLFIQEEGKVKSLTPILVRSEPGGFCLKFKEVQTVEEARGLVGSSLLIEKDSLPLLAQGEYYWFQLQGLEVFTERGQSLGRVEEIMPVGPHDVLVVRKEKQESLVPAVDSVVTKIDLKAGIMVVDVPAGLLGE